MGVVEGFREPPFWSCKDYICKTGTVLLFKNKNTLPPKTNKQTKRQISSIQLLSRVQLFATPWIAAHEASLSFTISWSLLKLMSIESVMPSNHLILCHPLLPHPQSFPVTGSSPVNQLFTSGGQSTGASALATVLPMSIQA